MDRYLPCNYSSGRMINISGLHKPEPPPFLFPRHQRSPIRFATGESAKECTLYSERINRNDGTERDPVRLSPEVEDRAGGAGRGWSSPSLSGSL